MSPLLLYTDQIRDLERDRCLDTFAFDAERNLVADPDLLEFIVQIRQAVNRLAIGCNDDVAKLPARSVDAL